MARRGESAFRWAICSETFPGTNFKDACLAAARCGYSGIEVEPLHLGPDPAALSQAERKTARQTMVSAGVEFVGFHSLLRTPPGMHLTTPDEAVRTKSWDYFRRLIDLAADLGSNPIIAFGSSRQRNALSGTTSQEAAKRLADGMASVAGQARSRKVTILVEPLAPHLCNVVNSLEEAMMVVRQANNPAIATMFDSHNAVAETLPHAEAIRKYKASIRHVHLNELDGRYPGSGNYPFKPILQALKDLRYRGWVSVELFEFKPDGETVARRSIEHLRKLERELQ